jgi:hypothetical protein
MTAFLAFLTFFKGDPSWGPRYLTPVFALAWLFAPAAAIRLRRPVVVAILMLGALVQVLGLSVDAQRLHLRACIPFDYYRHDAWLSFVPDVSHLLQRPAEIWEIISSNERATEFSPGPTPTYAPTLPSGAPAVTASTLGLLAPWPHTMAPVSSAAAAPLRAPVHLRTQYQTAVKRYQVFASLRPWWISQTYLSPAERPVGLMPTVAILLGLGGAGFALIVLGLRLHCGTAPRGNPSRNLVPDPPTKTELPAT